MINLIVLATNDVFKNMYTILCLLDINNNGKLQQNHVHPTIRGHPTYCREHIMVQEYQNNHLKDFLLSFFYLADLMEHSTEILFKIIVFNIAINIIKIKICCKL